MSVTGIGTAPIVNVSLPEPPVMLMLLTPASGLLDVTPSTAISRLLPEAPIVTVCGVASEAVHVVAEPGAGAEPPLGAVVPVCDEAVVVCRAVEDVAGAWAGSFVAAAVGAEAPPADEPIVAVEVVAVEVVVGSFAALVEVDAATVAELVLEVDVSWEVA